MFFFSQIKGELPVLEESLVDIGFIWRKKRASRFVIDQFNHKNDLVCLFFILSSFRSFE